jgi:site-specific recombinase XerD
MRFKQAVTSFRKYSLVHHSKGTQKYYREKETKLLDFFGNTEVTRIDRESIFDFITRQRHRNPKITNNTLNKYIAALKFILKNECDLHLVFKKLPEIEKITPTIPRNIIYLVFNYYSSKPYTKHSMRNHLMFNLLLDTGLRINELLNIRIDNIDFDSSSIFVNITKTNLERYVFYKANSHSLLRKYIEFAKIEDYLFIDFDTNEILKVDHIETICYRLKNELGIKTSISPHKWRHTFATEFQKEHQDLEVLRVLLGHKKISTTQRYLHLDREHLHKIYFSVK